MTVKKYIEHLKTLDQDANIWCIYDCGYSIFEPIPIKLTEANVRTFNNADECLKEGDYGIIAG